MSTAETTDSDRSSDYPTTLVEIAGAFIKLGTVAFGGPAAHLAMMEEEFVRRRQWLSHAELVDMIGAANLVPGPNSTEVAIHIGHRRRGVAGMLAAGICFIVPAALIVSAIAAFYVRFGSLPSFQAFLYGVKPVVVAVVAQAIVLLVRKAVDDWPKGVAFAVSAVLSFLGVNEIVILLGAGVGLAAIPLRRNRSWRSVAPILVLCLAVGVCAAVPLALQSGQGHPSPTMSAVFLYFLKVGSVLYGSGYVLLAFLQHDLVAGWRWLGKAQLLDAVAVGQFTPGPVFTTATFIGYVLGGPIGAVAATIGIFLPSFLFVGVSDRLLPKLRASPVTSGFMDGVNAAALALMAVVLVTLATDAIRDALTAAIAVAAVVALLRFRTNSALLILVGGLLGLAAHRLGPH